MKSPLSPSRTSRAAAVPLAALVLLLAWSHGHGQDIADCAAVISQRIEPLADRPELVAYTVTLEVTPAFPARYIFLIGSDGLGFDPYELDLAGDDGDGDPDDRFVTLTTLVKGLAGRADMRFVIHDELLAACCALEHEITAADDPGEFVRGDANDDARTDIADPIVILGYLFLGGAPLRCGDAADMNDSGSIDLSDALYGLAAQFLGGPPPAAPHPECGSDPSDDTLDCQSSSWCD